ncbi:MAG: EAL domain-containing protein [Gemmatimonadetes bacterium]|nr:EAL domain-containing protein [Gemmatimonadota bacterium]
MSSSPHSTPVSHHSARRNSAGEVIAPLGRMYLWFPTEQALAKVVGLLRQHTLDFESAEGDSLIVDVEWSVLRDIVGPLRRLLTHTEADDTRVLYKPAGGKLSIADFPTVKSYSQFALVSQSTWLRDLLDARRYTSVLQPIVHAADPSTVYAREALLRGAERDGSIVYAQYLFEVARGCGMLAELDLAARDSAIEVMTRAAHSEALFLNLTPSAIDDPLAALAHTVEQIDRLGLPHERVVFEVVESENAPDMVHLRGLLATYREAGFRVALDDVGAGYSSLNRLHQLRPDFIKLDMDLVRHVDRGPYKALVARKTIEIATELGVATIAEGVETEGELAWAQKHGAAYVQGYATGRPSEPLFGQT